LTLDGTAVLDGIEHRHRAHEARYGIVIDLQALAPEINRDNFALELMPGD